MKSQGWTSAACRLPKLCSHKRARSSWAWGFTTTFLTWTPPTSTTSSPTTRPSTTILTQHFWLQRHPVQVHEKLYLTTAQLRVINLLWHFQDRAHFARVLNWVFIELWADQSLVRCCQVSLFRKRSEISVKTEHLLLAALGECADWDSVAVAIDW